MHFDLFTLFILASLLNIASFRKAIYRRNSRHLKRLSRNYDWELDERGGLRPITDPTKVIRSTRQCANDSYILKKLLAENVYNQHKIPGGKVFVTVEVWVQEVTTISDITSDFQLDIYISEMWTDPALYFEDMNPCKQNISLNSEVLDKLWTPNSCFINSKTADIHKSPFSNIFLLIYSNGSVWTNYRLKLQGPCLMDLTRFPFDNVTCSLTFESFNYNTDEVEMQWSPLGVMRMREKIELADYALTNISYIRKVETYPAGFWHELTMYFEFKRRAGWYILQAYLPTYLTICISWVSFALGTKAIPARTMLGVNSLLAMTFQFGNIIRNLPRVSYVKAIDVWMLSCMTFVFCSLLELAWVGYLSREDEVVPPRRSAQLDVPPTAPPTYREQPSTPIHHSNPNTHPFQRKKPKATEEEALLHNDYGYIPPGFGLNGTLARAVSRTFTTNCMCDSHETQPLNADFHRSLEEQKAEGTSSIVFEAMPPLPRPRDQLALKIDKMSVIFFPFLFAIFNVVYWWHYALRNWDFEEEKKSE
ncbi:unnamed protein product, partial [Mesorhabditis belari]|uniref:Uncharacterized protein n=1 Tax=Mesorhabditis belari TaxID=2138241 RepID=A0AAF3EAK4_9BILA